MSEIPAEIVEAVARKRCLTRLNLEFDALHIASRTAWLDEVRSFMTDLPPAALAVLRGEAVAVPVEATDQMLRAAGKEQDRCAELNYGAAAPVENIYDAMLAASPWAPKQKENEA